MTIEVHRHEASKLKEAWIDEASMPAVGPGNRGDDRAAEPVRAFFLRQLVDGGRANARVDRASFQNEASRKEVMVARFHKGDRRQHRHAWLTHAQDVHIALEYLNHADHIVDVI